MQTNDPANSYQRYKSKRHETQLGDILSAYFDYLESVIEGRKFVGEIPLPFMLRSAFGQLSRQQKINYITSNLSSAILAPPINRKHDQSAASIGSEPTPTFLTPILEAACHYTSSNPFKQLCSPQMRLQLYSHSQKMTLTERGKTKVVNLHYYLVSRVSDRVIKLFPCVDDHKMPARLAIVSISLHRAQANQVYDQCWSMVMRYRNQELVRLYAKLIPSKTPRHLSEDMILLSQPRCDQFLTFKKKTLAAISQYAQFTLITSSTLPHITISRSIEDPNLFKFTITSSEALDRVKRVLVRVFNPLNQTFTPKLATKTQILQQLPSLNLQAIYQKYEFTNLTQQMIFIQEVHPQNNECLILLRAIDNIILFNLFQFMVVSVCLNQIEQSEINVQSHFNMDSHVGMADVFEYFEDLRDRIEVQFGNRKSQSARVSLTHRQEDMRSHRTNQQVITEREITVDFGEPDAKSDLLSPIEEETLSQSQHSKKFTKQRYRTTPLPDYKIEEHLCKKHFLEAEWRRQKDGELVCINEALLKEHKKVFKHIITSVGSNILRGNNVLNVSLPVTIFKKQSHLQMLATSFSMAPKLLEGVVDPLERMKAAILLMVSVGILGISIEKPFYPNLGETLQVWIAGCPMYFQQISRFPPVGAYLLKGRGYDIYGQVEPKIGFGLNSGKGYNQRPCYIRFHDGTQIEVSFAKISINGLFMGDRSFNFQGKMFAYDSTNHYFATVQHGPKKTHLLRDDQQPKDFIFGEISKTSLSFAEKFYKQIPRAYPKDKHILEVCSRFEGTWNGEVEFDGTRYFDFARQMPSIVEAQINPLPSDCQYRPDLLALIDEDLEAAQREKTELEEQQRRDRKLREKFL